MVNQNMNDTVKSSTVKMPFEKCDEVFVEELGSIEPKPIYSFFKRVYDIVFSVFAILILLLPMLIMSIIIRTIRLLQLWHSCCLRYVLIP